MECPNCKKQTSGYLVSHVMPTLGNRYGCTFCDHIWPFPVYIGNGYSNITGDRSKQQHYKSKSKEN